MDRSPTAETDFVTLFYYLIEDSEITMDILLSLNHTSFISVVACNLLSFRTVEHNLCMYINQQDTQNSVMRLYFPLDALHVSDYISPSSGATL